MSRGLTLATGRGKTLVLIAAAMLLASLAVSVDAIAPRRALAEAPNCNSMMNPVNADGIDVSIASPAGFFYDATDGKWYTQAVGGTALASPTYLVFTVDYGKLTEKDAANAPWCVYYEGSFGNNQDWIAKGTLTASDSTANRYVNAEVMLTAASFSVGQTVCIGARLPARIGDSGAPKDHQCFTVQTHTTSTATPTPSPTASPTPNSQCVINCGTPTPPPPQLNPTPTPTPTATPTASVEAATLPPSDSAGPGGGSSAPLLGLLLLILAGIVGGIGLLTPSSLRIRR